MDQSSRPFEWEDIGDINEESRKAMKHILEDINSGRFAEEWTKEWTVDLKNMKRLEKEESEKQIEMVGQEIRQLFERKK
jgi:ketol-acid reductoisomerase